MKVIQRTENRIRIIAAVVLFSLILMIPQTAQAALDLSAEAIYQAIMAKQDEYYEGRKWDNSDYYEWNGGVYDGGYGCSGFAFAMSDAAFGKLPARVLNDNCFDAIRPGDILRVNNNSHSVIVLQKFDDYVVVAEGNMGSKIHWGREITKAELDYPDRTEYGTLTYIMTRYPTDPIEHHYQEQSRSGNTVTLKCTDCGLTLKVTYPGSVTGFFREDGEVNYLERGSLSLQVGDERQFWWKGIIEYSDEAVVSEISDGNVATFVGGVTKVNGSMGRIEAVGNGTATLTVRSIYDNNKVLLTIPITVGGTVSLRGTVSIDGVAKSGNTLTAVVTNCNYPAEDLSYYWGKSGHGYVIGNGQTYQLKDEDVGAKIFCVVTKGSLSDEDCLYSTYTDVVQQADPVLTDNNLKISKKSLTLFDTITIDFKVSATAMANYHDPYLTVTQNDVETKLTDYREADGLLIFNYRVAPHMMGDNVTAVPHALNANGEDVTGVATTYSVKTYCQNMLNSTNSKPDEYVALRKLLVDILVYGDAAQVFDGYKTNSLVSDFLSDEQRALGTTTDPNVKYQSVRKKLFATVKEEDALASIETAALFLEAAVNIQFKFTTNNLTGLRVVVTDDEEGTHVIGEYPATTSQIDDNGRYYVALDTLNAGEMRKKVYATVMKGDKKVSNTFRYSIESYVSSVRTNNGTAIDKLLDAMMNYGDSAANFASGQ